jgi:oligopeptide/dipeptide ABC transporter ATP-binding protein
VALLEIDGLTTEFATERGRVRAVDGVSLAVDRGQTVGVVGESGCGKSVTALSIMRLVADPPGRIAGGRVLYDGTDLLALPEKEMRARRGKSLSMIFQEPMTSLNPVYTAGEQVAEAVRAHEPTTRRAARARAVDMLRLVGIPAPEERAAAYPHQLSGGMRQRVMIAMALVCRPGLLIADEPTTALDVTIQAQILELLGRLRAELGMGVLLITHDLGVVAETCDEVVVMYAGRVVEQAPVARLFAAPRHPYTGGLLASVPRLDLAPGERLTEIPGMVPPLHARPPGCKFQDRCARVEERCRAAEPPLAALAPGHLARCWFPLPEPAP